MGATEVIAGACAGATIRWAWPGGLWMDPLPPPRTSAREINSPCLESVREVSVDVRSRYAEGSRAQDRLARQRGETLLPVPL